MQNFKHYERLRISASSPPWTNTNVIVQEDEDIILYVGDESEHLLHARAEKIKERFRSDAEEIMFTNTLTFEQQTVKAQELLKGITED